MRTIYLIRHGKPDFPDGKKMCLGSTDIPMGAEGFAQAQIMADKVPAVTAVFSSPLLRAVQTAKALGRPVQVIPGLREYHMGQWDGLTFCQIRRQYPALYEARGTDCRTPVPGEEDPILGARRFAAAMQQAVGQSTGDIAVVAHGGVISAFVKSLGGKGEKPDYAGVTRLTYDGTFHLKEEETDA